MATFIAKLHRYTGDNSPRDKDGLRASQHAGFVPVKVGGDSASDSFFGVLWINKASMVGNGGTGVTITSGTSTLTITE